MNSSIQISCIHNKMTLLNASLHITCFTIIFVSFRFSLEHALHGRVVTIDIALLRQQGLENVFRVGTG